MGQPTEASIVRNDGTELRVAVPSAFGTAASPAGGSGDGWSLDGHEVVELGYAYGPELLPWRDAGTDGMWRYRALLPLDDGPIHYPLAVGGTPLLALPALRREVHVPKLWLKDETRGPSGSNKDRATALVLEWALRSGARRVTCASTGNVAVSLAVGAAAAGLEAVVFVGADVDPAKLRLMLAVGATVVRVRDGYGAAFRLSRAAASTFGWVDRNTGVNPMTTEAKKTVALEVWDQLGRAVPDVVIVPVGDGPTLAGAAKGFREVVACGGAERTPRLIGVQAEGIQPIKRAWEANGPVRSETGSTIADGIAVGTPISGSQAIREVRRSGGAFVSVTDDEIRHAVGLMATRAGVLAEPAAAAGLAGLVVALDAGLVERDERIVVLVTGSGLKTPHFLPRDGRVLDVGDDLEELRELAG